MSIAVAAGTVLLSSLMFGGCEKKPQQLTLSPGKFQVVIAPKAPSMVRFAASEMTNFLALTLGCEVPIANAPAAEKGNVFLGVNEWSAAAGLDPSQLKRDGFISAAIGKDVYLVGIDDEKVDSARVLRGGESLFSFQRGTLNAVYDFLERYADSRFYFPTELGTCVARKESLSVPVGVRRVEPVFTERYYGWWSTAADGWPDKSVKVRDLHMINWLRLRYGSSRIQCCHGQRHFHYVRRFAKEHPDWFCLQQNGKRNLRDTEAEPYWRNSKFCYSSPIRKEIYKDVKAYLSGESAASRGLDKWGANCVDGKYVDIMPEDAMEECFCPKCQKAYDKSTPMYASDFMWKLTAEIAGGLQQENIPGNVMMMAYPPYRDLPKFKLPSNVQVMVAVHGPWSAGDDAAMQKQLNALKDWNATLGHKVWLWTYPGKYSNRLPGIPEISPRAYAKFFSAADQFCFGGYADNDTDRMIYESLNVYAYAKLGWDPHLDIEALLSEFHRRMFGEAAAEMQEVFDTLEEKWVKGVCTGRTIVTSLGPTTMMPSTGQLWGDIYTPAVLSRLQSLFDKAKAKVAAGSLEARRIAFFKSELLGSLVKQAELADPARELKRRAASKVKPLVSADFDTTNGWFKSTSWGTSTLDKSTKLTGSASVKIVSDKVPHRERNVQGDFCVKLPIENGRTYRVSYFIKAKDVVAYDPKYGCGLCLWIDKTHYHKHPNPYLRGTFDWIHQEMIVKADATNPQSTLQFRLEDALGTFWIDGIRVEEVKTAE